MKEKRPWGTYEVLLEEPTYKVKRIIVQPHQRLSLQSHQHRSEHWVVVEGLATIWVGDKIEDVAPNETRHIPKGVKHRLENKLDRPIVVIEVQCGNYFGEDDIMRYEDDYGRLE